MNMKANVTNWNTALEYAATDRTAIQGKAIRPASHASFDAEDLVFAVTLLGFVVAVVANFCWLYQ